MVATRIVATVLTTTTAGLLCAASPAFAEGNATDIAAAVPQVSTEGALGAQDTEFRALFADWKSMEKRDTGRVSIPSRKPVDSFKLTSQYGFRADPFAGRRARHKGLDMAGPIGTPIYATADGVVTHAGWDSGYGRLVKIQHAFGIETRYAHLSQVRVEVGQRVSRGDRIGDMGNSGRSTGPHLHYEIRVGGEAVNPMIYIRAGTDVF